MLLSHRPAGVLLLVLAAVSSLPAQPDSKVAPRKVRQIKVLADKAPDCSSLEAIVKSVTRGCKTNDEKAIALYNFMQLTHYHQGYPGEKGGLGALKEINVYGWSLCGGLHTIEASLWRAAGWKWRYVGWSNPGHTTVEAFYDGRWHYLDVFLRYYTWTPDAKAPGGRTIASQDDIKANPALVTRGLRLDRSRSVYYHSGNRFENVNEKANWRAPSFLSCGDEPAGILTGIKSKNRAGSPTGWAGLEFDSPNYSTDVNLAAGYSLTLTWDATKGAHWWNGRQYVPGHGCGDKDFRNCPAIGPLCEPYLRSGGQRRSFANGQLRFAPDFAKDFIDSLAGHDNVRFAAGQLVPADGKRPASITVELQSPYIMTRATGTATGAERCEISLDDGKTFKAIKLADFSEEVGGNYRALVRLSFSKALTALNLEATVQCNRGALPYLSPGKNKVTVTVADPKDLGDNRLVVTYAYEVGSRSKSYEALADSEAEVARAHYASWSKTPTVAQKVFKATDLPATFEIDIPTPAGKYPVYPRMLFLRREVVSSDKQIIALPRGSEIAKPAAAADLQSLPNPFTVGTELPPKPVKRPTSKRVFELKRGAAVSMDGKTQANHYLKWKKGETWVQLIEGGLDNLPPARDIAAARLIVPVSRGHDKAATKVGVTLLAAVPRDGKPFDFKQLGEVVGTTVVPAQPDGAEYNPAKKFDIDLTRLVKQIASGELNYHGLALRVIPDRAVDDGYLIRLDLPTVESFQLEVDVYDRR